MLPPKRSTRTSISLNRNGEIEITKLSEDDDIVGLKVPSTPKVDKDGFELPASPQIYTTPHPSINIAAFQDQEKENPESQKKTRRKLTDIQRSALEDFAKWKITPSLEARRTLADQVGLELKVVSVWFQNKRRHLPKARGDCLTEIKTEEIRAPFRNVNKRTCHGDMFSIPISASSPVPVSATQWHASPVTALWDRLPSSSPEPTGYDCANSSNLYLYADDAEKIWRPIKRRSLDWACDNEGRNVKRMRKSLESPCGAANGNRMSTGDCPSSHHSRRRTDRRPQDPSPSVRQASALRHTKSLDSESKAKVASCNRDILEIALTLVQMKKERLTSTSK